MTVIVSSNDKTYLIPPKLNIVIRISDPTQKTMQVLFIVQFLLLLSWSSPTIGQCGNEDWTSTFAIGSDSTSQCKSSVSYVNGLRSEGYGALLETGPGVIKAAKCCSVDQPYSQESNYCYKAQWWTDLQRYVKV